MLNLSKFKRKYVRLLIQRLTVRVRVSFEISHYGITFIYYIYFLFIFTIIHNISFAIQSFLSLCNKKTLYCSHIYNLNYSFNKYEFINNFFYSITVLFFIKGHNLNGSIKNVK